MQFLGYAVVRYLNREGTACSRNRKAATERSAFFAFGKILTQNDSGMLIYDAGSTFPALSLATLALSTLTQGGGCSCDHNIPAPNERFVSKAEDERAWQESEHLANPPEGRAGPHSPCKKPF
jgi:hypothetical protein